VKKGALFGVMVAAAIAATLVDSLIWIFSVVLDGFFAGIMLYAGWKLLRACTEAESHVGALEGENASLKRIVSNRDETIALLSGRREKVVQGDI